jgi:4-hydroxy-tetrahydrodipicolinate synthase
MAEFGRVLTAMVTPFREDGSLDTEAARRLAIALLDSGSDGLVVAGTTGEAPALSHDEKLRLFREVKAAVGDRGAVIAGTGTNNTAESVELTREAEREGVDGMLAVVPYYNKPTQEGLYRHFEAIAGATSLPLIVYNIPSRTSVNMTSETTVRLSRIQNIAGVKESNTETEHVARIISEARPGFRVWSGNDEDTLSIIERGGYGVVSVISHLVGAQVKELVEQAAAGRTNEARAIEERLAPLIKALFLVTSPIPVKYALRQLGFEVGPLRLPMCDPEPDIGEQIMAEVRKHRIDLPVAV